MNFITGALEDKKEEKKPTEGFPSAATVFPIIKSLNPNDTSDNPGSGQVTQLAESSGEFRDISCNKCVLWDKTVPVVGSHIHYKVFTTFGNTTSHN